MRFLPLRSQNVTRRQRSVPVDAGHDGRTVAKLECVRPSTHSSAHEGVSAIRCAGRGWRACALTPVVIATLALPGQPAFAAAFSAQILALIELELETQTPIGCSDLRVLRVAALTSPEPDRLVVLAGSATVKCPSEFRLQFTAIVDTLGTASLVPNSTKLLGLSPVSNTTATNARTAVSSATTTFIEDEPHGDARAISGDGRTIVGFFEGGLFTPFRASRWTEATGLIDLGTLDPANDDNWLAACGPAWDTAGRGRWSSFASRQDSAG